MSRYEAPDMWARMHDSRVAVYKRVAKLTEADGKTTIRLKRGWIFPSRQATETFDSLHDAMVGIHAAIKGRSVAVRPLNYMDDAPVEARLKALTEVTK